MAVSLWPSRTLTAFIMILLPDCGKRMASCQSQASRASLRPRKKYGTVRGFSVVDPGGNWLRISKLGESEQEDSAEKAEGLAQIIYVAARLGDAHGDEALALKTLESGLTRFGECRERSTSPGRIYIERNWPFGQQTMSWLKHHLQQRSRLN